MTHQPCDDTVEDRSPGGITCRESVRMVSLLRDHELGAKDELRLALHIQACPRCHIAGRQFEQLFDALDELLVRKRDQT
jgi:hypothetical protein